MKWAFENWIGPPEFIKHGDDRDGRDPGDLQRALRTTGGRSWRLNPGPAGDVTGRRGHHGPCSSVDDDRTVTACRSGGHGSAAWLGRTGSSLEPAR